MAKAKQQPYVRGLQDIRDNQKTFQIFWDATAGSIGAILLTLLILGYFFT